MPTIKREDIIKKLSDWREGKINVLELERWSSSIYSPGKNEFEDWEGELSISNEILNVLDLMKMNLITKDDIPFFLKLLNASQKDTNKKVIEMQRYFAEINYEQRKEELKSDPFYFPFCS